MKVFLDTNILIDYLSRREPFFEESALILQLGKRKKCQLLVSSLSFATASFILQAHYKMPKEAILKLFNNIIKICNITPVDSQTVFDSIESDFSDFEDAMQYYSALRENAEVIITRNLQDFSNSQIPAYTPNSFLNKNLLSEIK